MRNSLFSYFEPTDFCQKETRNIKICENYNCETKYCSINEFSCMSFIQWKKLIKKYVKEPQVYKKFMNRIKKCDFKDYKNIWAQRNYF